MQKREKKQYKIKLLFGDKLSYGEGDLKPFQITYFCKSHGKTYRIRKSNDKFICGEYEIDETDIDDVDDIIGIGAGLEITAEDLRQNRTKGIEKQKRK